MKSWAGKTAPREVNMLQKSPPLGAASILPWLLSSDPRERLQAVEGLLCALRQDRDRLLQTLVGDSKCQLYLEALGRLLAAPDVRLCSNVAYILGTIAEDEVGASHLVLLAERPISEDWSLLGMLGAMLKWEDSEAVMNAAGTLGTLAETSMGQQWLLKDPQGDEIIENITLLLDSSNEWTASNSALVLARISLCHEGCAKLLSHATSDVTLKKLIASLKVDEAGCGMNAAFAIGRLCGTDNGLKRILSLPEAVHMVLALELMMAHGDAGGSRNACFALSCLAADTEGHKHTLKSPAYSRIIDALCRLLQSEEQESSWFAAMTVKVLASQPRGVVKLREHPQLEGVLKRLSSSKTAGKELLEEVTATLHKLQRLPRPRTPETKPLSHGSIKLEWNDYKPPSGMPVIYKLFEGDRLIYQGPQCGYEFPSTKPGQEYCFTLIMETEGDRSPCSSVRVVSQEESVPSCPVNFRVIGRTASHMKLIWAPPAEPHGVIKSYTVCRGDTIVDSTQELSCIVGGLLPATSYTFSVCACTSRGKGEKAFVEARTTDTGDHAPEKLTLYIMGRSEIFISWDVPKFPLGRFFNYELCMNGKVVYLGTERTYTARRLTANTEYTCTVSAITSEGRCESRPVTRRTAKDEYENINKGYSPMWCSQPATTASGQGSQETAEKPAKSGSNGAETLKRSPGKTLKAHLLLSQRVNRSREEDSVAKPSIRSRRDSPFSWSTVSSEEPQQLSNEPVISCSTSSMPLEGQYHLCTLSHPTRLTADLGKVPKATSPPATRSDRSVSVAILESLGPEFLVQQRSKTESELLRGPLRGKQEKGQKWKNLDYVLLDKAPGVCFHKTLEPEKDFILRINRRNLGGETWKHTSDLGYPVSWRISEPELPRAYGKNTAFAPMQKRVLSVHVPKNLLLKDHLFSQARASFQGRLNTWSQLHPGRLLQVQPQRTGGTQSLGKPVSSKR
ncbi:uncharacterized protein [Ambystoma mexicanum]|uniref:uncharacterized protein isoform X2 n=1 Tax=Ambystoma mexicanum TaxID=8296 RepID=UPI0037E951DA